MDKLWAPWRLKYITQVDNNKKGCVFCNINKDKKDKKNFVFARSKYCYAVLNIFPYNNGHVLVLPCKDVNDLSKMRKEELSDLMDLLNYTKSLVDEVLNPHGYNIGMNLGRISGAGVPGHVHFHVVPRWRGDMNFMSVVSDTKVISQSLKELYAQLSSAHKKRIKKEK